ncbi:HNH endonuclease [Vitiosangium sp. GDMCC 1.1324]|uniref:HNH endonuclease n=1 Tax=Vitiosangium sp. (strain GDMCC 1.1324) TaxID=2138576 RepID=UPI000D353CE5|nr:HNH endonuclease [Vitiosangium sp. GDMCC 1.1324]PTL75692.1 hypothetical protein DAT35_53735 [Vitiosangium sp. GDMCC 1.1324]
MGASLQSSGATSTALQAEQSKLAELNTVLKSDLAQAAVDVAGIVDPTPISDVIGAGMSVARGDWVGAGLSLISVVPYVGDALGKTAKGARLAGRIADLKKGIESSAASIRKIYADRRAAAAIERAKRKKEAAEAAVKKKKCQTCPDEDAAAGKYGTRLPRDGKWSGEPGNSDWLPDPNTERGKAILEATGGKPIAFKEGYPDFSPYAVKTVEIDMVGKNSADFRSANAAAGFPGSESPKGYTWHHKEDGVTMELVPFDINKNVPHEGGSSVVRSPGY